MWYYPGCRIIVVCFLVQLLFLVYLKLAWICEVCGSEKIKGDTYECTFVWHRETNNLLIYKILGCFVEPAWELRCLMVCPESPVMAVPAADSLTPTTAVTSVGNLVIMPTTVIVSARGVVDAAGTLINLFIVLLLDPVVLLIIILFLFLFRSTSRSRSRSRGRRYRSRSRSNERQVLSLLQLCLERFTV